jgi:uncharacterized membrane protein YjjP (DUF1212 family)
MLRAGNTATRTREWIELLARKMDFDSVSVSLSFDSITASLRHPGGWDTAMREIGPLAIGVWRIGELERLAKTLALRPAPGDIAIKLEIESALSWYSAVQTTAAIGVASGAFAFLNGAAAPEMIAAAIGGAVGQALRSWLSYRYLNQYGAAALSAIAASGVYVLVARQNSLKHN